MTPDTTADKAETVRAAPQPESSRFWGMQIELAEKEHKEFFDYASKVEKRYKGDKEEAQKASRGKRFAILYSNTETIKSALYARTAKPDVRQRWTEQSNKITRTAGIMLERSLSYCADATAHDRAFRRAVHDMALVGRGIVRVVYEPKITTDPATGQDRIEAQKVDDEFVSYRDWLHSPARCWGEVWWVAFRHKLTRADLEKQGFEDASEIPLNWVPDVDGAKDREVPDELKRAEVWEIWDKSARRRVWFVKGYPTLLRADPDPYGLEGYWPMAEPVQAIAGNDSYVPRPYYIQYEDQAADLDEVTQRISVLTKALKRRGVYNASVKELKRLAKAADNEFIPSENFAEFAAAGGMQGAFQSEDISQIANVLEGLYAQRNMLVQSIYEVSGISDVMRGSTDPNETLGAQQLKAQFGTGRMKLAQMEVQRWVRDTLRVKSEIIAEHFEPATLMAMSGMNLPTRADVEAAQAQAQAEAQMASMQGMEPPQPPELPDITIDDVMELLRQDKIRGYQIDIETDSTVFEDMESEKTSRVELLTAMSGFLQQWTPLAQAGGPPMVKLGFEMMSFGVRAFAKGRHLEDALEEASAKMLEQMAQPPPEPPPDPRLEVEKLKAESLKLKTEADMAMSQQDMMRGQQEMQFAAQKHGLDMQRLQAQTEAATIRGAMRNGNGQPIA